jgi:GNAT superfamily N-acetyltransferase
MTIRRCTAAEFADMYAVCNDGAAAYRGIIAADQWKTPYMSEAELRAEMLAGVEFFGAFDDEQGLVGVMGLQQVGDITLIRHAYTRTTRQGAGIGSALLAHLLSLTHRPVLVGTWRAATWAIQFYERRGFTRIAGWQRETLLRRYWTIPERQIEESVVLGNTRWVDHEDD